jgi:hypothetical protein
MKVIKDSRGYVVRIESDAPQALTQMQTAKTLQVPPGMQAASQEVPASKEPKQKNR